MAANTNPIYSRTPDVQWGNVAAANTAKDGTGTQVTVFTADATEGGYVRALYLIPLGTNIASVLRVFLNNGSSNATPANNSYLFQVSLPATTNSEVASIGRIEVPMEIAIPPGYKLNVAIGTTVAAGWEVTAAGGKY